MNIYVGNLPRQTTEDDLRQTFEVFGQVESINIVKDRVGGESRGFGFVSMPAKAETQKAIEKMNGRDFIGRTIKVEEGWPRTNRYRGGGRGRRSGFGGDRGGRRY